MNSTATAIVRESTQTQAFCHNSLTCKCGITMKLNAKNSVAELTVFRR
jgi:hypothetical protein